MQEGVFMSGEVLVVDLLYHQQDSKVLAGDRVDYRPTRRCISIPIPAAATPVRSFLLLRGSG